MASSVSPLRYQTVGCNVASGYCSKLSGTASALPDTLL
jgi:hypothetical protein